ncbi:MAG: hypothetical protein HDR03_02140 [Lachnospiraceae bacterium]|nr:hypothetical protein [Lachnospiraceae bacterium]
MNIALYSNRIDEYFIIYPNPDIKVLEKLKNSKTRTELWDNLPTELEYDTDLEYSYV